MAPSARKVIMRYVEEKGYKMGKSSLKEVDETYAPGEMERWVGKAVRGKRLLETIEERGLSTDYVQRDEINVLYFIQLEKEVPAWPWAFRTNRAGMFA